MPTIELPYKWSPRNYQIPLWRYFEGNEEGKRAAAVWHRRAGKDLLGINLCATKMIQRIGTYWHLLPTYKQGRSIVWNGFTRDGRRFINHFPPELLSENPNNTQMKVTYQNGSIYQVVGTDNVDSLVGTNPVGCIFSEYSLQDPSAWDLIRPILAENGGWALFIYTARGRNHGYRMIQMALKNPKWFSEILVAGNNGTKREDGTPVVSDAIIQDERDAGMDEAMIQQEFYCSFDAPLVGAYYGSQLAKAEKEGRLGETIKVPYESRLPVNTWWDLGIDDSTTIWFTQQHGTEVRVIDYYENHGEGLPHYARVLRGQVDGYERMGDYVYGTHTAPHDIEVRELGTGRSRLEAAASLGIKFRVGRLHEVEDGIEAVRGILSSCWFDWDHCARGIDALKSYRKEWDEKRKVFMNHPLHDWSSHGADAFRIMAWNMKQRLGRREKPQERAVDEYQYV